MGARHVPGVRAARSSLRRRFACLVTVAAGVAALVAAPSSTAAPRPADRIVPVWAMADGRLPLAGATVRVVQGGTSAALPSMGQMRRTYTTGTYVFRSDRRLRDFTVSVTGGRMRGAAFDGTLRAVVRAYRPPTVVHVNPVTTLVAAYLDQHPEVALPEAIRRVKHFLELPAWSTIGRDVRRSHLTFDGSRFLDEATQTGGFDQLVGRLAKQVDDPATATHPFRAPRGLASTRVSSVDGAGLLAATATSLGDGALGYVGGQAAGWLLDQFGLGDGIGSDLAQIQQQLEQLSDELTAIRSQLSDVAAAVVRGTYSQLAANAAPILGAIDYSEAQLSLLANLPPGPHPTDFTGSCATVPQDDERAIITCKLVQYIQTNLVGQDAVLNKLLVQSPPGADSILVAASKSVRAATTTFFDPQMSDEVGSVLSYYSLYEAELLNLLVEYDHTLGAAGGDEAQLAVQQTAAPVTGYAAQQQAVMKPSVPSNQVIDLRSGLVWQQQALALNAFYAYDIPSFNGDNHIPAPWSAPTSGQLDALISGWTGSPQAWLTTNAGMDFAPATATLGGDYGANACSVYTTDFDAGNGAFVQEGFCASNGGQHFESDNSAFGLVFRPLDPSESYWYTP